MAPALAALAAFVRVPCVSLLKVTAGRLRFDLGRVAAAGAARLRRRFDLGCVAATGAACGKSRRFRRRQQILKLGDATEATHRIVSAASPDDAADGTRQYARNTCSSLHACLFDLWPIEWRSSSIARKCGVHEEESPYFVVWMDFFHAGGGHEWLNTDL